MQTTVHNIKKDLIASTSRLEEMQEKLTALWKQVQTKQSKVGGSTWRSWRWQRNRFCRLKFLSGLQGKAIEIERAHHLYANEDSTRKKARTLIFKLLSYNNRQTILKEGRNSPSLSYERAKLCFFFRFQQGHFSKMKSYVRKKELPSTVRHRVVPVIPSGS